MSNDIQGANANCPCGWSGTVGGAVAAEMTGELSCPQCRELIQVRIPSPYDIEEHIDQLHERIVVLENLVRRLIDEAGLTTLGMGPHRDELAAEIKEYLSQLGNES